MIGIKVFLHLLFILPQQSLLHFSICSIEGFSSL
jgi:hypothetical protein